MSNPGAAPQGTSMALTFTPPPHELPYYDALFNIADPNKSGILGGAEAVQFLSRSGIPTSTLKNIWSMADQNPKTNTLDKPKFFIVVRLIQLFQNENRPQGATLAVAEEQSLKPANFEGISGTVIPLPPPVGSVPTTSVPASPLQMQTQTPQLSPSRSVQQSQPPPLTPQPAVPVTLGDTSRNHATALTAQDPYVMFPHEQSRYDSLFPNYEKHKDGYVYGAEAVALFSKSGLSKDQLRDIWNLSDNPVDNRLDKLEFAIAMHLIVCISKKNLVLPVALPPSLQALKNPTPPVPSPQLQTNAGSIPPPATIPVTENTAMPEAVKPSIMSISDAFSDIPIPQPGGAEPTNNPDQTMTGATLEDPALSQPPSLSVPPVIPQPQPHILQEQPPQPVLNSTLPPPTLTMQEEPPTMLPHPTNSPAFTSTIPSPLPAPIAMVTDIPEPTPTTTTTSTAYEYTEELPTELEKLQTMLTLLQAENISLKAQKQSTSEEESDTNEEISSIVTEIEVLSKELQGLRHEVSEAKASLIEAVSELKLRKLSKNNLTEAIAETKDTLNVLHNAVGAIQELPTEEEMPQPPVQPNAAPAPTIDFFGGFSPPGATSSIANSASVPSFHGDGSMNGVHTVASSASDLHQHQEQVPIPPQPVPVDAAPFNGFSNDPTAVPQPNPANDTQGGFLMGGMVPPQMANPVNPNAYTQEQSAQQAGGPPAPSQEEVSQMKAEALAAADTATKAEQEQQFAFLRAEELQRSAEGAEHAVKGLQEALSKKTKGFKRGNKKAQKKEYELALQKAVEFKKELSDAQGKITQLQVVAMKAKREADQLHQKWEQAEFDMVKAASVQEMQPQVPPNPNPQMYVTNVAPHVPNGGASQAFDNPFQTFGY